MNEDIEGASAEIFPDLESGKVITRFYDPETDEMVVELHLDPDMARDYAFTLTRASLAIEDR